MISVDIRYLEHLLLVITHLLELAAGKHNHMRPGERQHYIDIISRTNRQLKNIIADAKEEELRAFITKGYEREADQSLNS